ncbi:hypothetical protein GCM10009854_44130 [Saccharopolyspora halophila]|uniref:Uncharacterized protein n=1 Tax=Saccharopolyspora halophila TaxID=405551 RepID=A0ABP5TT15_9PSEU
MPEKGQAGSRFFEHLGAKRVDPLATVPAIRFLEADGSLGSRRFHLADDQWYEIGERSRGPKDRREGDHRGGIGAAAVLARRLQRG